MVALGSIVISMTLFMNVVSVTQNPDRDISLMQLLESTYVSAEDLPPVTITCGSSSGQCWSRNFAAPSPCFFTGDPYDWCV